MKRIVVKLGTKNTVKGGRFHRAEMRGLVEEVSGLVKAGHHVALVSSGAIALGATELGVKGRNFASPLQEAVAATGQSRLIHEFRLAFAGFGQPVAQLLLTRKNFSLKERGKLGRTLETLFRKGVVPIINENDAAPAARLIYNADILAARVAREIGAHHLVILSDVDGLYTADPHRYPHARKIPVVEDAGKLRAKVGGASAGGVGGFASKLQAHKLLKGADTELTVAKNRKGLLGKVLAGEAVGTRFRQRKPSR